MEQKKKVYAYFDGSNFYHLAKSNYGVTQVKFNHLANQLLRLKSEELVLIRYFIAPVNQQESLEKYSAQQKFLNNLIKTPLLDLYLGKLVRRPLKNINILCPKCGLQTSESLNCPSCGKIIKIHDVYKSTEKGVDVHLGISLLLDALENKYDIALLFSGDADFCPAIKYILKNLNKEIIFCHFPIPKTNELIQCCSDSRLITKEMLEKSKV